MKRVISTYFLSTILFISLSMLSGHVYSIDQIPNDSVHVELKVFDSTQVSTFKNDPDFKYNTTDIAGLSLWDRLKLLIGLWIAQLLSFGGDSSLGKALVYILCLSVIVYVVLKLLKVDIKSIFYKNSKRSTLQYHSIVDDIHAMDFDTLVKKAIDDNNFREAVRLLYLAALKQLADHDYLNWKAGKTNHEYMNELSNTTFHEEFDQLSYYFDYSWYGQFAVTQKIYNDVSKQYELLSNKIKK